MATGPARGHLHEPRPPPTRTMFDRHGSSEALPKVALVCSSGGHLFEMLCLRSFWSRCDSFWVTFPTPDAVSLLEGERVINAAHPTNRNLPNLLRNLLLAWRVLRNERPDAIVSTGAGVAVPFLVLGRLFGVHTVYVESITRIDGLSLTGRLVKPFVDEFLVQWPELARSQRGTQYAGQVL